MRVTLLGYLYATLLCSQALAGLFFLSVIPTFVLGLVGCIFLTVWSRPPTLRFGTRRAVMLIIPCLLLGLSHCLMIEARQDESFKEGGNIATTYSVGFAIVALFVGLKGIEVLRPFANKSSSRR